MRELVTRNANGQISTITIQEAAAEIANTPGSICPAYQAERELRMGKILRTYDASYELSPEAVAAARARQREYLTRLMAAAPSASGRAHLTASGRRPRRL